MELAQLAERQGRRVEARALYEQALYLLRDPASGPLASSLLRWIGRTYQEEADAGAALDCHEAALAVARASGDEAGVGHAINMQAAVHWQQGRLEEAERLFIEARASALRAGESKLAAMTSQNLGVIANVHGELPKALQHYEASLTHYRSLGLAKDVWGVLNNLAMLYTDLRRWEAAERAYGEALQIAAALGDLSARVLLEVNLAEMWVAQGRYERAREAFERAMELSREIGDTRFAGEAAKVYGVIERETGDHRKAEEHFAHAVKVAEERQDLLLLAETVRERAELHRRQGRNRDTLHDLNKAYRLFSQLSARRELADIDRRTGRLEGEFLEVVRRWGESIESKDRYTQGHCERVADLACRLAQATGMDDKNLFWFRIGALLHDVGKLVVPTEVLNKPGPLTEEEWTLVRSHPSAGVEMLSEVDFPWDVIPIVQSHHERWDGAGYPHRLAGEAIPRTARILCIADVYDALTSERSYKRAMNHDEALRVMRADVGHVFDPGLFGDFEAVVQQFVEDEAAGRETDPTAASRRALGGGVEPEGPRSRTMAELPAHLALPAHHGEGEREEREERDDLTGVLVRRAFIERATAALDRRQGRDDQPLSLLVVDVDHFKLVNDTYGHLQGDDVLRSVASVFAAQLRGDDAVGRYAGDEFVVLLPGASLTVAHEVAERLRLAVQRSPAPLRDRPAGSGAVAVTLSIGVAAAPEHGDNFESLFAAADRALYEAKRKGRNAVGLSDGSVAGDESAAPRPDYERFVGRGTQLRRLVRLLESSVRGEPAVVAIVGEAGVGKSTLLRQLAPEVRLRAGALVRGRCLEADVRPPYGAWADIISALHQTGVVPPRAGGRAWRELPRIVPELGGGPAGAAGAGSANAEGGPAVEPTAGNKYVLVDEIAEYLKAAAEACPVVLVLDDMQWADAATWDTLEHLLPLITRDRLLVCLTIRAEDAAGDTNDRRLRLVRDERFHEIPLERLTPLEVAQWVEGAFQGQTLGRAALDFIYEHSEGNPLLVAQLLRTLVEEEAITHADGRWRWRPSGTLTVPVAVGEVMSRRLQRLSPEARTILVTAAAAGRVFDIGLVVAGGAGDEDDVLDAIDEAVAAAVLEPAGDREGPKGDRYTFTHALLVVAVLRSSNPRRLRRIHERLAQVLETRSPGAVADIAVHYDRAEVRDKAFKYALEAGQRAVGLHAHDEATAFYMMAHRHAGTLEQLAEVRFRLAGVAEAAGRYAEAEGLCDMAVAWFGDQRTTPLCFAARRMRERLRALQGRPPQRTLAACHELLAEAVEAGMGTERVALLTMISQAHSRLGELAEAERIARECLELAEATGDPALLSDARMRLGNTLLETRPLEAVALYTQALESCSESGDRYGQARCYINTGIAHARAGDGPSAERAYTIALDLARSAHAPDLAGLAALNLGVWYIRGARFTEAEERLQEALLLFTTVKNEHHRLGTLYNLAHMARENGNAATALELYQNTTTLARTIGHTDVEIGALAGAGLTGLTLGRGDVARSSLEAAAALIGGRDDWWFQGRELHEALVVRVAMGGGDHGAAAAAFYHAHELAERHDPYGASWLASECAPALAAAGDPACRDLVDRYAAEAKERGYTLLIARYDRVVA